ncbi:MAG: TFIIB-type zinc ribbon-containing protein [Natronomonas sp.]
MKVRGRRECQNCGQEWSYYETGEITCPACGSIRSVGTDDRSLHTASAVTLDLAAVRDSIDSDSTRALAEEAVEACRPFVRKHGFVDGGDLQPLSDTYLAAVELQTVAGELSRRLETTESETYYFHELLRADRGHRPPPEAVPESLRALRGLACAEAVDAYRGDLRRYDDERTQTDGRLDRVLERLDGHVRRIQALDGYVSPTEAERLVDAASALGRYVAGETAALAVAADHLDRLR